jgi:hypothetical protein
MFFLAYVGDQQKIEEKVGHNDHETKFKSARE